MASATTAPLTKDNNMLKFYQLELDCGTHQWRLISGEFSGSEV